MIPKLRNEFNRRFSQEKYRRLLQRVDELGGAHVEFRISETPCFFPKELIDTMSSYGTDLIRQLVEDHEYHRASDAAIPAEYNVPNEDKQPLFVQVDFGLVRDDGGNLMPKLVEIQAFPSLYGYQLLLSQQYIEVFGLDENLRYLLGGLDPESYRQLLRGAIVGDQDPRNVVLMEIDPREQKTLVDFLLTEKMCGIKTVNITDILKIGKKLYYRENGKHVEIRRIYNRAIVDELIRKGTQLPFSFREELDVEWAGHPNWFFRISKFSIPYLNHPSVPRTWFLHQLDRLPDNLGEYVLKPLFSFAGLGVLIGPSKADVGSIPREKHSQYIIQERVDFEPIIETPHGPTKAEIRVMYIWADRLLPVLLIIRTGRGKMMGVDHNRNMEWVGASAGLYL